MTLKQIAVQVKSFNGQCDTTCNDCATVVGLIDKLLSADGTGIIDGAIVPNAQGLTIWQQGCNCYVNFQYDDVQLVDGTILKPCDVCLVCGCIVDYVSTGAFDNIFLPNLGGVYGRNAAGTANIRMATVNAFDEIVFASSDTGFVISDAGGITIKSGGINRWNIDDTGIIPSVDEGASLGALLARVNEGYFGDLNLKNLGQLQGRNLLGTGNVRIATVNANNAVVIGNLLAEVVLNDVLDSVVLKTNNTDRFMVDLNGNFIPALPSTYSVGISNAGVKEVHIGNAVAPGTPVGGYVIYATAGALFGKGSAGTITPLGAA